MSRVSRLARGFARDPGGVAAVEFALIAPVLVALLLGTVTLFGMYRDAEVAEKSTFTIGDVLSRKTEVTTADLDLVRGMFVAMTRHRASDTTFRVTSIMRQNNKFVVCWSYAPAPLAAMTTSTIPAAKMPLVADGDSVVLVETTVQTSPLFSQVGLSVTALHHFSAARPRFTAAVKNTSIASAPC